MPLMRSVSIGLFITATLLCLSQSVFATNADCKFPEAAEQSRPGAEQGPTAVSVAVYLLDIPDIDDADQSFIADVFLRFTWEDPRLVHARQAPCIVSLDEVWHPRLILLNQRKVEKQLSDGVQVSTDGSVVYRQRFYGTFSLQSDLRNFPFDQQNLPISVVARLPAEEVVLIPDPSIFGIAEKISVANWLIGTPVSESGKLSVAPGNPELARFDIHFPAQRNSDYYVWKIFLPMSLVIFMAWTVFWVSPQQPIRLSISATSMLTLIAFRLAVSGSLPPIPYLTELDLFTIGSTALVFAALVETVVTTALWDQEHLDLALRINSWSRVAFPLTFIAFLGFMIGF
jgi:hypothetical protein